MSAPSLYSAPTRRVPVQDRSERRVATLLAHAAEVIAEVGYEATTMTEVAARSKASIGSVYQYFPNKEALTIALRKQYVADLEARWAILAAKAESVGPERLGAEIVDLFFGFAKEKPAFFPLMGAPSRIWNDPAARNRLREQFGALLLKKNPAFSKAEALQVGIVVLQAVKGMNFLCAEARPKERPLIVAEHKRLLAGYLSQRLPHDS
jgi:AcrR family transcriptional regulator